MKRGDMHVNDPQTLASPVLVFLLGLWTLLTGQRTRREERARQDKKDAEDAKARADKAQIEAAKEQDRRVAEESARAERFLGEASYWRGRCGEIQSRMDELQALHDRMLSEWIEIGTTRAEQLELTRIAYRGGRHDTRSEGTKEKNDDE